MRHCLQHPTTKRHWGLDLIHLVLLSQVAMLNSLHLMVRGSCSLHAPSSPWAFLGYKGAASPSAAGKTTVHKPTALPLLVGEASYWQHPLICYQYYYMYTTSITTCILRSFSVDPQLRIASNIKSIQTTSHLKLYKHIRGTNTIM